MLNKICLLSLIIAIFVCRSSYGFGGHKQFIVQDKVVQLNQAVIQPLLVPQNQYNNAGYWAAISQNIIRDQSDEIATKVVDKLIDELLKRGYLEEVPDESGENTTPSKPTEPTEADKIKLAAQAIFQRSCVSCHQGAEAKKIQLFNEDGSFNASLTKAQAYSVLDRVEGVDLPTEKIMPQNASPLVDDEIKVIRKWVRSIPKGE